MFKPSKTFRFIAVSLLLLFSGCGEGSADDQLRSVAKLIKETPYVGIYAAAYIRTDKQKNTFETSREIPDITYRDLNEPPLVQYGKNLLLGDGLYQLKLSGNATYEEFEAIQSIITRDADELNHSANIFRSYSFSEEYKKQARAAWKNHLSKVESDGTD